MLWSSLCCAVPAHCGTYDGQSNARRTLDSGDEVVRNGQKSQQDNKDDDEEKQTSWNEHLLDPAAAQDPSMAVHAPPDGDGNHDVLQWSEHTPCLSRPSSRTRCAASRSLPTAFPIERSPLQIPVLFHSQTENRSGTATTVHASALEGRAGWSASVSEQTRGKGRGRQAHVS